MVLKCRNFKEIVHRISDCNAAGNPDGAGGIINQYGQYQKNQQEAYNKCTLGIEYAAKAHNAFLNLRSNLRDIYIYNETGDRDKYLDTATEQASSI